MSLFKLKIESIRKRQEKLEEELKHTQDSCPHNAGLKVVSFFPGGSGLSCNMCNSIIDEEAAEKLYTMEFEKTKDGCEISS